MPVGALSITLVVLLATLVVAALFLIVGGFLIFSERWRPFGTTPERVDIQRNLGMALLPGAIFTLAIFALQLYLDLTNQHVQDLRDREARHETVQLAIATTKDLSGFDPRGEPLRNVYLAGKILDGARFGGADLRGAQLRVASLKGAELADARLQRANLINADLSETVLTGANLAGAELRLAKFDHAELYQVKSLQGAIVDARTCWPIKFMKSTRWQQLVGTLNPQDSPTPNGGTAPPSPGHPCAEGEHASAGPSE